MMLNYNEFIEYLDRAHAHYWIDSYAGYANEEYITIYEVIVQTGDMSMSFFFDDKGELTNIGL